ncbi:unnamed protein product [Scytosiphon promiscuus]
MEKNGRLFQQNSNHSKHGTAASSGANRADLGTDRVQLVQPSSAAEVDYGDAHTDRERGQRLLHEMKRDAAFWAMRASVEERVSSSAGPRDRNPEKAVVNALDELGYRDQIRSVAHGAHARGLRRQMAGRGSLPAELRCLYPEVRTEEHVLNPSSSTSASGRELQLRNGQTDPRRQQQPRPNRREENDLFVDPEPLDHVRKACARWRANVADELRALAAEKGGRFAWSRADRGGVYPPGVVHGECGLWSVGCDGASMSEDASCFGGGSGSTGNTGINADTSLTAETGGFLFDSADLLDAVSAIRSPNRSEFLPVEGDWGMVHVQLRVESLEELRQSYRELSPELHQTGLDDRGGFGEDRQVKLHQFTAERLSQGRKILKAGFAPEAMEYARRGVTDSLRPALWRAILGLPKTLTREDAEYFGRLMSEVKRTELVTDGLYALDVQFISDDDKYFPFEASERATNPCETLHDVILAFSRDPWILRHSEVTLHDFVPITEGVGGGTGDSAAPASNGGGGRVSGSCCPPCGPFRGLVNYAAVLCFLFEEREAVYFALRAMFARYWCRLNALRSGPGMLLRLLKLFESLVQRHHPRLVLKLLELGVQPLQLAMPWIQFGFVTYLEADQVLLLWDRLLGYDSLDLLAVLAASVLVFRADLVLQVSDAAAVMEIFSDGRQLEVVPLLQAFMFPGW